MYAKNPDTSGLRMIGARLLFVHMEAHRVKLDDRVHGEKFVGFSNDSRAYPSTTP